LYTKNKIKQNKTKYVVMEELLMLSCITLEFLVAHIVFLGSRDRLSKRYML